MKYIKKINGSKLFYDNKETPNSLIDYHKHILKLIIDNLKLRTTPINISFCTYNKDFDLNIYPNVEHLIRKNGEQYDEILNDCFHFNSFNKITEYSITNIIHNSKYEHECGYKNKCYYVPALYKSFNKKNFKRDGVVTIHNVNNRRYEILKDINHFNISNEFNINKIYKIYKKHQILLNIHQTDNHLTFEELRCLPALASGILVISEDVPYKEHIPYGKHIIWSNNIQETIINVQNNYEEYRKIYLDDIESTFEELKTITKNSINNLLNYESL